jgi:hypothetical protein
VIAVAAGVTVVWVVDGSVVVVGALVVLVAAGVVVVAALVVLVAGGVVVGTEGVVETATVEELVELLEGRLAVEQPAAANPITITSTHGERRFTPEPPLLGDAAARVKGRTPEFGFCSQRTGTVNSRPKRHQGSSLVCFPGLRTPPLSQLGAARPTAQPS